MRKYQGVPLMPTRAATMRAMLPFTLFLVGNSAPAVSPIGAFDDYRFTEEHQYGFDLHMWTGPTGVLGCFFSANGLQGDTPRGPLRDAAFDKSTGALAFRAVVTVGLHFCRTHTDVPAVTEYRFKGRLRHDRVTGTLWEQDTLHPEQPPSSRPIVLKRSRARELSAYSSFEEWSAFQRQACP